MFIRPPSRFALVSYIHRYQSQILTASFPGIQQEPRKSGGQATRTPIQRFLVSCCREGGILAASRSPQIVVSCGAFWRRLMVSLWRQMAGVVAVIALFGLCAEARVTRVEIISRGDVADGRAFGLAGAYERIIGRVYFAVKPENIHNRQIVDLDKAPRNAQGEVEFSADLYLYKPKDMARGNNAVLFEVSNRGGRGILRLVDGGGSGDAEIGDGFLLREGYMIAWVGWQFDLDDQGEKVRLGAPIAQDAGGKEIRGLVRSDFTPSEKKDDMPLGHILLGPNGGKSYPVDDPASGKNVLSVRDTPEGARQTIPRGQWSFGRSVEWRLVADPHFIHLDGG